MGIPFSPVKEDIEIIGVLFDSTRGTYIAYCNVNIDVVLPSGNKFHFKKTVNIPIEQTYTNKQIAEMKDKAIYFDS